MAEEVAPAIHISDAAFEYLMIQRGRIANLSSDRARWTPAYIDTLVADFDALQPFLPASADRILDVGSGLGGIDILLARHLHNPEVWLLDGDDDSPVMVKHAQTFNCMRTARRFLEQNGVSDVVTISPALEQQPAPCDLIVSLQSWCFHYAPAVYLDFVRSCCRPGTVLAIDVRRDKPMWQNQLDQVFTAQGVAMQGDKYDRRIYKA